MIPNLEAAPGDQVKLTQKSNIIRVENLLSATKGPGLHWPFIMVLLAYLVISTGYSRLVPPWESPDEPSHFTYVRHIQKHGGPPIQSFQGGDNEVQTGHHPPFYYFIGSLLLRNSNLTDFKDLSQNPYFSFSNNDGGVNLFQHYPPAPETPNSVAGLYTLRNLSIFFGLGTLVFTYLSGLLVFGRRGGGDRWNWASGGRLPSTLAVAITGLVPQFNFLSGSFNNDNGVVFFCAGSLWVCLWLVLRPGPVRWQAFALSGLIFGLGMLTKYNEIAYLPLIVLAIGLVGWQARDFQVFVKGGLVAGGVFFLLTGWWFMRATLLYGDPAGWKMWRSTYAMVDQSTSFKWNMASLSHIWSRWFDSFWGEFGWMNILFEPKVYHFLALFMVMGSTGLLLLLLNLFFNWKKNKISTREVDSTSPQDRTVLCLVFLGLPIVTVILTALNYAVTFGDAGTQGRYLFPLLPPFSILMAAGFTWLFGHPPFFLLKKFQFRWINKLVLSGAFLPLFGTIFAFSWLNYHALNDLIIPAYRPPGGYVIRTLPPGKALPPGAKPGQGEQFSPGMRLEGYMVDLPPQPTLSEQKTNLKLTFFWLARHYIKENWITKIQVYSRNEIVGIQEGPPGNGNFQTFLWQKGDLVRDERSIPVDSSVFKDFSKKGETLNFKISWRNSKGGAKATLNKSNLQEFNFSWPTP